MKEAERSRPFPTKKGYDSFVIALFLFAIYQVLLSTLIFLKNRQVVSTSAT